MNTDAIESMVRDVLSRMNSLQGDAPAAAPAAGGTSRSAKVSDLRRGDLFKITVIRCDLTESVVIQ